MPWTELVALIAAHVPVAKTGRPSFDSKMILRIYFLQQWFGLSDWSCPSFTDTVWFKPKASEMSKY